MDCDRKRGKNTLVRDLPPASIIELLYNEFMVKNEILFWRCHPISYDVAPRSDFVDDVAALRLCSVYLDYLLTYHFAP